MCKYEIDFDKAAEEICEGCPLVWVEKGCRDSFGAPIEPDTYECPLSFEPEFTYNEDEGYIYCAKRGLD